MFWYRYQYLLSQRISFDLFAQQQWEKNIICKLRATSDITSDIDNVWSKKCEMMLDDIEESKKCVEEFKNNDTTDLNVSICSVNAWNETFLSTQYVHSSNIIGAANNFKEFYLNKYKTRRKLRYLMDAGTAMIKVEFNDKISKTLIVSTSQMIILLLFNIQNTLTFQEIMNKTYIDKDKLTSILSIMCNDAKLLIEKNNEYQINCMYSNEQNIIYVPKLIVKSKQEHMAPIYDGRHQMDAAIVRIMKARKTLKHADLVTEVVKQLRGRFTPKPVDIKKRIANLIELEYLERDEYDRRCYHYKM